jgi:hypothetical protein
VAGQLDGGRRGSRAWPKSGNRRLPSARSPLASSSPAIAAARLAARLALAGSPPKRAGSAASQVASTRSTSKRPATVARAASRLSHNGAR